MQLLNPSIIFSFLITAIILNQIPTSCADNVQQYKKCSSSFDCANFKNLSYPFWGPNRPQYCGHPSFELQCKDEFSSITIMSQSYRILEVIDSDHRLKVVRTDYWDNICPNNLKNTTIGSTFFDYGSDTQNLTIYYDCLYSPFPIPDSFSPQFNCSINGTQMVNYFMLESVLENGEDSVSLSETMGTCKSRVMIPILDSEAERVVTNSSVENLKDVIDNGFEVEWSANNSLCHECQSSGGHCGYDPSSKDFTCFCKDGSFPHSCRSGKNSNTGIIIGAVAGVAALVCILGACFLVWRRKKKAEKSRSIDVFMPPSSSGTGTLTSTTNSSQSIPSYPSSKSGRVPQQSFYFGVQVFTYEELEEATDNFHTTKEIGEGGFGTVYKGELKDGRVVAVKRHYESNFKRVEQFMNEVKILAHLRHKNLVTLFGCTSRSSRELLLVYEYIPNGTVADHLHGKRSSSAMITWPLRLNIAVETAEALAYLHKKDVIHRDVKSNNILLDEKFHVKVADFGLSRLFPTDVTHVSTAPQGTPGYVDPEYYQCYQLTDKSDVYSFGVLLVELISSLQAVDITRHRNDVNLANMAVNKIQSQELNELVDPELGYEKDDSVRRMTTAVAELAFRCLQQQKDMRPSMDEVLEILNAIKSDELETQDSKVLDVVVRTDELVLLKKGPYPTSPDSVADKWTRGMLR
ncbi:unnamed protein product [Trifolium pratense]|uniref:Uncharacterized protein n=1 Tax=Trifolium pratense TaxID=57577 RepID=A0ACB0K4E9_TRIPR|nr:unnamed protein product [Trifolium pratense]